MTNSDYENHVAEILRRINSIFHDMRFEKMSAQKYQAGLNALADYSAELATLANDWKDCDAEKID